MKLQHPSIQSALATVASVGANGWLRTVDWQGAYVEPGVDPIHRDGQARIYIFWHEYILAPFHLRPHCGMAILLSRHRDADLLAAMATRSGFDCVRGSTFRGASSAVRELLRRGRGMHLALTPDGPRGPRRQLAQGAVYLASKLGMPIVPIGVGYDRPWRVSTWDRFAIPRPYSQGRCIVGPEMYVIDSPTRQQLEKARASVAAQLQRLTQEAEDWATTNSRRIAQVTLHRSPTRKPLRKQDTAPSWHEAVFESAQSPPADKAA